MSPSTMVLTILVLAFAADDASLTGKWQIHTNIAGYENDYSCDFIQKDNDLTGSCNTGQGTVQIKGKVEGKTAGWGYKSEYNGSPITITFKGTIEGGKMKGSVMAEEYNAEGEFTAARPQ